MSTDLYLVPVIEGEDFAAGMALFEALESGEGESLYEGADGRKAAKVLTDLDPRYTAFEKDYTEIARLERIREEEARRKYDEVQLNGTSRDGKPLSQFNFYRDRIIVHIYSGSTESEINTLLVALCRATGFGVVDPQSEEVYRLRPDGRLA